MSQKIQVVLATDLYEERLEGDEPEPMRVDKVNLRELSALAQNPNFSEGRALAALKVQVHLCFTSPKVRARDTARPDCGHRRSHRRRLLIG